MKGMQREDYIALGGRTPFQRHLRNNREEKVEWALLDDLSESDVTLLQRHKGAALEEWVARHFLTRRELSTVLKAENRGKKRKERTEYYDFLVQLRDKDCVPAIRDVMSGIYPTARSALLKRLEEREIFI